MSKYNSDLVFYSGLVDTNLSYGQLINKKRKRGPNFCQAEKSLFLELLEETKDVIENKKTDGVSLKAKAMAWIELSEKFNSLNSIKRNPWQLKELHKNMKSIRKKSIIDKKVECSTENGIVCDQSQIDADTSNHIPQSSQMIVVAPIEDHIQYSIANTSTPRRATKKRTRSFSSVFYPELNDAYSSSEVNNTLTDDIIDDNISSLRDKGVDTSSYGSDSNITSNGCSKFKSTPCFVKLEREGEEEYVRGGDGWDREGELHAIVMIQHRLVVKSLRAKLRQEEELHKKKLEIKNLKIQILMKQLEK